MDLYDIKFSKLLLARSRELYFYLFSFYISSFWKYKCKAYLHIWISLDFFFPPLLIPVYFRKGRGIICSMTSWCGPTESFCSLSYIVSHPVCLGKKKKIANFCDKFWDYFNAEVNYRTMLFESWEKPRVICLVTSFPVKAGGQYHYVAYL